MISVVTTVIIKEGKKQAFLKKFKEILPKVQQEPGYIEYFAAADVDSKIPIQVIEENVVMILEKWHDVAALHKHLGTHHIQTFLKEVESFIENVSIKVLQEI